MAAASKLLDAAKKNNKSNKTKSGKSDSSATGTTLAAAASAGAIAGTLAAIKAQESAASDKDEKVELPANFDSLPEDVQKRILDSMAEASQSGVKSKFSPDIFKESVNKSGAITPPAAIPEKYLPGAEGGITDERTGKHLIRH